MTTYFQNHLPALSEAVDLQICFLSARHAAASTLESSGISPGFFGRSKWDPRAFRDAARLVRRLDPDLIHLTGEKSLIVGGLIAKASGIPSVMHLHDAIPLRPPLRPLQRKLSRSVDLGIVITEELRDHATREYGFEPEQVRVLLYGMHLDRFAGVSPGARAQVRSDLSVSADAPLLGVIGRVNRDKGQLEAIQAMRRIVDLRPDARLVVVGDGPGRSECEAKAADLGLRNHVIFAGQRADVPEVLVALDLVLMPSMWYEGFGFVALEAIASGRPVVAFDSGGIKNTVVHGRTGVLVERGDVEGLARETLALIEDADRRSRFGEAGREHAKRFTVPAHVASLLEIYDELPLRAR